MVFSLFGVKWVILKGVIDLLACWQVNFSQSHRNLEDDSSSFNVVHLGGKKFLKL